MSSAQPRPREIAQHAAIFAALGDETRLALVGKLSGHAPVDLRTDQAPRLTRRRSPSISPKAKVVTSVRAGREAGSRQPEPFIDPSYLERVSAQWDHVYEIEVFRRGLVTTFCNDVAMDALPG
jgi:hypothetical protein